MDKDLFWSPHRQTCIEYHTDKDLFWSSHRQRPVLITTRTRTCTITTRTRPILITIRTRTFFDHYKDKDLPVPLSVLITTWTKTCFNHKDKDLFWTPHGENTCFDCHTDKDLYWSSHRQGPVLITTRTRTCFDHHTKTGFDHHKDKDLFWSPQGQRPVLITSRTNPYLFHCRTKFWTRRRCWGWWSNSGNSLTLSSSTSRGKKLAFKDWPLCSRQLTCTSHAGTSLFTYTYIYSWHVHHTQEHHFLLT